MGKIIQTAEPLVPRDAGLPELRAAAKGCQACDLWKLGTQTVFGEGPVNATVVMVGEQPGDQEDRADRPFVGPAGQLLDRALARAGIDRSRVYITNSVKHFKWQPRGKRRIHSKPDPGEVEACIPWLHAELAVIRPNVVVCMGATAAQALLGKSFRVTRQRGQLIPFPLAPFALATLHPSAILRAPDDETREQWFEDLVNDLEPVARILREADEEPPERRIAS